MSPSEKSALRIIASAVTYLFSVSTVFAVTTIGSGIATDGMFSIGSTATLSGGISASDDVDFTFLTTENFALTSDLIGALDVMNLVFTPGTNTSATNNGVFIQQASSAFTNGLDSGIQIENNDNIAVGQGVSVLSDGTGGFDDGIQILATAGIIVDGIQIGSGAQLITNAINIASTGVTTDLRLQNSETIDNNSNDTIILTGSGGAGTNEVLNIDLSAGPNITATRNFVLVNDNFSIGIDGNTTENIADANFIMNGDDMYIDDQLGVNGIAHFDGNIRLSSSNQFVTINTGETLTIENTTGTDFFTASATTTSLTLQSSNSGTVSRLCHGGGDGVTASFQFIADCNRLGNSDLAEMYGSDGTLEAGEIVIPGERAIALKKSGMDTSKAFVWRSSGIPYEQTIIGIVSTDPWDEILGEGVMDKSDHPVAIALAGRVPVKVTNENGAIHVGDYLTASSTPGHAMKATTSGRVIGVALQSFEGERGTAITFVNPFWWEAPVEKLFENVKQLSFEHQKVAVRGPSVTLKPLGTYITLSCSGRSAVRLSEVDAAQGQLLIVNIQNASGKNSCAFPDIRGVQEGTGRVFDDKDAIEFIYDGDQWVQLGASVNEGT